MKTKTSGIHVYKHGLEWFTRSISPHQSVLRVISGYEITNMTSRDSHQPIVDAINIHSTTPCG